MSHPVTLRVRPRAHAEGRGDHVELGFRYHLTVEVAGNRLGGFEMGMRREMAKLDMNEERAAVVDHAGALLASNKIKDPQVRQTLKDTYDMLVVTQVRDKLLSSKSALVDFDSWKGCEDYLLMMQRNTIRGLIETKSVQRWLYLAIVVNLMFAVANLMRLYS